MRIERRLCVALLVVVLPIAFCICGCSKKDTPAHVMDKYQELKAGLDDDRLGESIAALEEFGESYKRYDVSDLARQEIERLQALVPGRFVQAQGLARDGEFERAHEMLKDLAQNFAGTDDGKQAADYLKYGFAALWSKSLLADGKPEQAEKLLQDLDRGNMDADQQKAYDSLLDSISLARNSRDMQDKQVALAGCRALRQTLRLYYSMNKELPASVSLDDPELKLMTHPQIRDGLSAIENYERTDTGFVLTAVSKDGGTRFRVTENGEEEIE